MGPFHLSLTVLVPYRSSGSIQPCGMVPAVSARIPRVPAYSGFRSLPPPLPVRAFRLRFRYGPFTLYGAPFQALPVASASAPRGPYYPSPASTGKVWAKPLSLATTQGIDISFFSCGYLDVSVPRVRPRSTRVPALRTGGFPHSDTAGSIRSPALFAAFRVLHRLLKPRHPPCALIRFLREIAAPGPLRPCCFAIAFFALVLYLFSLFPLLSMNSHGAAARLDPSPPFRRRGRYLSWKTQAQAPKRRCSSHTFRYGYLVTT